MTLGTLFTALGYLVGAAVLYWEARRRKLATEGMAWVWVIGLACALVGAKLTQFVAEGWPTRIPASAILDPRLGGRALLGGLIFGWLGVEIAKRRLGIKRPTGDLFALALPAGEAVGRIGCYFNGCCYGTPFDGPWACWQHDAWRHPAQIYSAITAALLFLVLLRLRDRIAVEGELFRWYLVGFGISRFFLEFFRWRESLVAGLSPMQWLCLELAAYGAIWIWIRRRRIAGASAMREGLS